MNSQLIELTIDQDLVLKQLQLSDAPRLFELTDTNRLALQEWLPWLDFTKTVQDSENFIKGSLKKNVETGEFDLGIWYQGEMVGVIGIHDLSKLNRQASIGYWLAEAYQGNGIMTRANTALIKYLFESLKLHRIVIKAATGNSKSQAIPLRLGFSQEGIEREAGFLYDHYVDLQVFSLLESEHAK